MVGSLPPGWAVVVERGTDGGIRSAVRMDTNRGRGGTFMVTRRIVLMVLAAVLLAAPMSLVDARDDVSPPREAGKVDLNTAGLEELQALPGIGPALARRIVEHRREHGPFRRVEDLLEVKGIGEKSLLRFRDLVMVSQPAKR